MAKFAKKKAAEKTEGTPGRTNALAGMKLYKVEGTTHKFQKESARAVTFASIKNGTKFETFKENGGDVLVLAKLITLGAVEARND